MEILGQTIDDAAGEAIDKCSKVMGLSYPNWTDHLINWHARSPAFTFNQTAYSGVGLQL